MLRPRCTLRRYGALAVPKNIILPNFPFSDFHGRIALIYSVRLHILRGDAPHREDGIAPDTNTGANSSLRPYPSTVLYADRRIAVRHGENGIIVIASEQQRTLRQTHVAAYRYFVEIVYPAVFTYPAVIANDKIPRRLDGHIVLDDKSTSYLCPKQTEQHDLDAHKGIPRCPHHECIDEIPQGGFQYSRSLRESRAVECGETYITLHKPSFLPLHWTTKFCFSNTNLSNQTNLSLTQEFYFFDHGKHRTHGNNKYL